MKSLLHTLHDNESILLMYLFDELPADDRAEVEAMLSTDAGLRAELVRLSETQDTVNDLIEQADATASPRMEKSAQRQAARAIDQWNTRRLLAVPPVLVRRRSLKWLAYSSGVAAAVLLGFLLYWGLKADSTNGLVLPAVQDNEMANRERDIIQSFEGQPSADPQPEIVVADAQAIDPTELLRKSLDPSEDMVNDSLKHVDLNAAEVEINTVAQLSDPNSIGGGLNFQ